MTSINQIKSSCCSWMMAWSCPSLTKGGLPEFAFSMMLCIPTCYLPMGTNTYSSTFIFLKILSLTLPIFFLDIANISAPHIWAWPWCTFGTNDTWRIDWVFAKEKNWNQGLITWSSIKFLPLFFMILILLLYIYNLLSDGAN